MAQKANQPDDTISTKNVSQDPQAGTATQRAESAWEKLLPTMGPIVITFLGAITYGVLRASYSRFYSRYGITPEDAGVDQLQVLAGALRIFRLGAFAGLTPYMFLGLVLISIVLWLELVFMLTTARWAKRFFSTRYRRIAVPLFAVLGSMLLLFLAAFSFTLPRDRSFAWRRIDNSAGVQPNDLAFLTLQADRSHVIWIETKDNPRPKDFPDPDHTIIYLGHADKTVVFFDPTTESTWRVPEDKILIQLKPLRSGGGSGGGF